MPAKRAPRKAEPVHALRLPDQRRNPAEIRAVFARCMEKIGFVPNVAPLLHAAAAQVRAVPPLQQRADAGRIRPLAPGARDDRRRRLLREPLPLLPGGHGAQVRLLSGDPVLGDQLVANYRAAPLSRRQRAMLDFTWKLSESPDSVGDADRAALRKAGFSDEDIFDIAEVAGFYNMTNRLAAAIDMRPNKEYYEMGR